MTQIVHDPTSGVQSYDSGCGGIFVKAGYLYPAGLNRKQRRVVESVLEGLLQKDSSFPPEVMSEILKSGIHVGTTYPEGAIPEETTLPEDIMERLYAGTEAVKSAAESAMTFMKNANETKKEEKGVTVPNTTPDPGVAVEAKRKEKPFNAAAVFDAKVHQMNQNRVVSAGADLLISPFPGDAQKPAESEEHEALANQLRVTALKRKALKKTKREEEDPEGGPPRKRSKTATVAATTTTLPAPQTAFSFSEIEGSSSEEEEEEVPTESKADEFAAALNLADEVVGKKPSAETSPVAAPAASPTAKAAVQAPKEKEKEKENNIVFTEHAKTLLQQQLRDLHDNWANLSERQQKFYVKWYPKAFEPQKPSSLNPHTTPLNEPPLAPLSLANTYQKQRSDAVLRQLMPQFNTLSLNYKQFYIKWYSRVYKEELPATYLQVYEHHKQRLQPAPEALPPPASPLVEEVAEEEEAVDENRSGFVVVPVEECGVRSGGALEESKLVHLARLSAENEKATINYQNFCRSGLPEDFDIKLARKVMRLYHTKWSSLQPDQREYYNRHYHILFGPSGVS